MQVKKSVVVILLFLFASILAMPFHEQSSMRNEAKASETDPKVLLVIRHGVSSDTDKHLKEEVGVMTSMLEEAGFKVIVASASGELIEGQTLNLQPNLKLADVKVNDYVGIIIPNMRKGNAKRGWRASSQEISLVKEAVAQGKPIAAQRVSVQILAEAGVLVGKKCTFIEGLQALAIFRGAIYSGIGAIQDGNIITSSHCAHAAERDDEEDTTSELTRLFIETIKE